MPSDGSKCPSKAHRRQVKRGLSSALNDRGKPTGVMDDAQNKGMSPDTCARKMISAAERNKKEVYIGGKEVVMVYFKRFLPSLYYMLASRVKPN